MNTSSVGSGSVNSCALFSLQPTHQKILQFALGIIILIGVTLNVLGISGYLPPIAVYVSAPGSIIALIALGLVSCARVVGDSLKEDFFVDVLNKGGYSINSKTVNVPSAGRPIPRTRQRNSDFKENLNSLREQFTVVDQKAIIFQFRDKTTEEAIRDSDAFRIALNFANEHHAGGGPGFHLDRGPGLFVYHVRSARAQEESLCRHSTLMASLTQLPHTLKKDSSPPNFIRSYYAKEFDSEEMAPFDSTEVAYVSQNHLFAVQASHDFYPSRYLEKPKAVVFVTSAAACYGDEVLDCSENSEVYENAKQRIETHLLAAAYSAGISKGDPLNQPVELILGAFGCGVFAPKGNPDEYRQMIANIYKELLPQCGGFFDVITFAVPTFGRTNPLDPAVANHAIFKKVLGT